MLQNIYAFILTLFGCLFSSLASGYSFQECEGSLTPYPEIVSRAEYPDSLVPVFISHIGRHGSRYPASDTHCITLKKALQRARQLGTITPEGERLEKITDEIIRLSSGQWGALDSLGKAEQRGIGLRTFQNYRPLFSSGGTIVGISSHSPRSIESMENFVAGMERGGSELEFKLSSGKEYNQLVRPFDVDDRYLKFRKDKIWEPPYEEYFTLAAPSDPIKRVLGENYPFKNEAEARDLSIIEYYVLAGCSAMSMPNPMNDFFSLEEVNSLWSCFNLRQYLQRTATAVSAIPAEIATPLVKSVVDSTDDFIHGKNPGVVGMLYFGHGETVLPLVSLLRLPGCWYITEDYATVKNHWRDFEIIPMAANVQLILFKSTTGKYYARIELNEKPVDLPVNGFSDIYPWEVIRNYMLMRTSALK